MAADGVTAGGGVRDQRLLVVLRLSPVPREPVRRDRRRSRPAAADRQAAALLQPPGLRRRRTRTATLTALADLRRGRARRGSAGLRHALDPDRDGRLRRTRRRCLRGAAPQHGRLVADAGPRRDRHESLEWDLVYCSRSGSPRHPVAGAGHQRPPGGAARRPARRRSWSSRSASCPTTWRSSTTSTPRPPRPPRDSD